MSQEEYLALQLDDQISWHDAKSNAPYNVEDKFPLLVKRIEDLLSNENARWGHGFIKQTRASGSASIVAASGRLSAI
jgi:hypothetical protein